MNQTPRKTGTGPVGQTPMVRLVGVTKRFHQVVANDSISLSIMPGRIMALFGGERRGQEHAYGHACRQLPAGCRIY